MMTVKSVSPTTFVIEILLLISLNIEMEEVVKTMKSIKEKFDTLGE